MYAFQHINQSDVVTLLPFKKRPLPAMPEGLMAQTAFVIREPPQIHKDSSCNFERLFIKLFDEKEITRDLERVNTRNFNFSITAQGNQIAKARAHTGDRVQHPYLFIHFRHTGAGCFYIKRGGIQVKLFPQKIRTVKASGSVDNIHHIWLVRRIRYGK